MPAIWTIRTDELEAHTAHVITSAIDITERHIQVIGLIVHRIGASYLPHGSARLCHRSCPTLARGESMTAQLESMTAQLESMTAQLESMTAQLESMTAQLESMTAQLQPACITRTEPAKAVTGGVSGATPETSQ